MSVPAVALDARQRDLLREAAEWRLISLLFQCPASDWRENLEALSSEITDSGLRDAAAAALTEATEGLYHSILGPGGPAPAREVSYRELVQFGGLMSELACYYDAFAYRPADREPGDHVSIEAGFLGYLRLKEAYALASGDAERAEVASEAATAFITDHLSFIAEPLARSLGHSGTRYLAIAGEALLQRAGPRRVPEV